MFRGNRWGAPDRAPTSSGRGATLRLQTRREAAIRVPLPTEAEEDRAPKRGDGADPNADEEAPAGTFRDDPDVERMLRVRAGDDDAFQELFLKHGESLLNLAYRFVGSRARAEEIVQEAFLRIYRAAERYEPRARFRTYASRVVINLALNELRRVEHQLVVDPEPLRSAASLPPREFPDPASNGGDGDVTARDIHRRVEIAIEKLPRNQKTALLLTRFDGYSYRQVAEVLETTNDAVKALVARATRALRAELGDLIE